MSSEELGSKSGMKKEPSPGGVIWSVTVSVIVTGIMWIIWIICYCYFEFFSTQDVRKNNSLIGLSFVSRVVFRFFLRFSRDYPYLQGEQFKHCPTPLQKDHVYLMSALDTTLLCTVTSPHRLSRGPTSSCHLFWWGEVVAVFAADTFFMHLNPKPPLKWLLSPFTAGESKPFFVKPG